MTDTDWRRRLVDLAFEAGKDGQPAIEHALLLAAAAIGWPRPRQLACASLMADVRRIIDHEEQRHPHADNPT